MTTGKRRVCILRNSIEIDLETTAAIQHYPIPIVVRLITIKAITSDIPYEIVPHFDVCGCYRWCEHDSRSAISGSIIVTDIAYLIIEESYPGKGTVHINSHCGSCATTPEIIDRIVFDHNIRVGNARRNIETYRRI